MAHRSQSRVENIRNLISKLPWWAGVIFALISYLILHWYAAQAMPATSEVNESARIAVSGPFYGPVMYGQYLLPGVFLVSALFSAFRNFKRKGLYDKTSSSASQDSFNDMSWRDFELLVGEYFRRWQFSVEENKTGTDGGVDLIARKDREKYLIRCKHSKAYQVGVEVVRDLPGVMAEAEATGGIMVTSGVFSKDAIIFARANNIMLVDGGELHNNLKKQVIFEGQPEKKTDSRLKKLKWVLASFLVVAICFSVLHFGKIGASLFSTLSAPIKQFFPNGQEHHLTKDAQISRPIEQKESKEFRFTDDQVKKAMDEVMGKRKSDQKGEEAISR